VGSVFKVKLFLPSVRETAGAVGALSLSGSSVNSPRTHQRKARLGYVGPRLKVLVVDNEEADRELLTELLQALGFELRTAASGHDCLDLLASGYQPDVIFMDLAMPGIDGWETIRRLRALARPGAQGKPLVAIVSANAFDKGLDNDVGIPPEDFHLKPVRHSELLDWLERRLSLVWLEATSAEAPARALGTEDLPTTASAPVPQIYPSTAALDALREVVALGYYRGIMNQLDALDAREPHCRPFTAELRPLAQQFQFEALSQKLSTP
jgi:CheY-like chemotaxis protein